MEATIEKEQVLVPFLEVDVPSHIKTEKNCDDDRTLASTDVKEELQPDATESEVRCPIKAEPPDVSHEGEVGHAEYHHWTSPASGEVEDRKPLRECPEAADAGEHGSTQPPDSRWGLCTEGGLPIPSSLCMVQLNPGDEEPLDPDEDPGTLPTECDEELYSTGPGCSTDGDRPYLNRHGEQVFVCTICLMQFGQKSHFRKHTRAHVNEDKYHCKVCGKQFNQSSHLVRHSRTHTGEKPYGCDVCGKQFTQSSHLAHHSRIHTGEKPYGCDACHKQFADFSSLTKHGRTHSGEKPYKCDACDRQFSQSSNLAQHYKTHTGEKPYKCEVCGKQFTQSSSLTYHSRTHSGEKPYKCNVCNKKFSQSSNLSQHYKTHSNRGVQRKVQCNQ